MRGKKQTFTYGNDSLSITKLLRKPEIVGYLKKDGPLTYGSQREKLRRLLRDGRINPRLVMEHVAQNPTAPRVQDTRYGKQRRRANLPKKTTNGKMIFGPEPPPRPKRPTVGAININGEFLTARPTLERYPQHRGFLQQDRRISEKSLHAKLRTWARKGKIPDNVINEEPPEFYHSNGVLDGAFIEYRLEDPRIHHQGIVSIFEYLRTKSSDSSRHIQTRKCT